jgi:hypothetical protein
MNKAFSSLVVATLIFGLAPVTSHAAGSAPVAWVSKQFGNDAAGCGPVTTPCKTFQYAHDSVVAVGGTINVRDAGGYGPLVIKNAISIINESGVVAGIFGPPGDAISIQAGQSDAILIKGLVLDAGATGANGINATGFGNLAITGCTVKGFSATGIAVTPQIGMTQFTISDTLVRGNKTGILASGLFQIAGAGAQYNIAQLGGTLSRVEASNNGTGIAVTTGGGYSVNYTSVVADQVNASANTSTGISVSTGSLYLTRSIVTANQTGVSNGGTAYSYGDNSIINNSTNWTVALTTVPHN